MLDFNTIAGVSIPFVGTTLGAAMVFFMKDKIHPLLQKALLGFSSGVMMAASVWSLLIPAMDLSTKRGMGKFSFLPAISGLLIGILLLLLFDRLIPHLHLNQTQPEGPKSSCTWSAGTEYAKSDGYAKTYFIHIIYTVHLGVRLRIYVIIRNNPLLLFKKCGTNMLFCH